MLKMSGVTEASQMLTSVKEEIKEEFDDFQEYVQEVEEKPSLQLDCKTETSATVTCITGAESHLQMEIKKEEQCDGEYGYDPSPIGDNGRICSYDEVRADGRCHTQSQYGNTLCSSGQRIHQQVHMEFQPYQYEPESDPEEEVQELRIQKDVSEWCTCGNCAPMPTEAQHVCCREIAQVTRRLQDLKNQPLCMVDHPGLEPVCLNVYSLQNAFSIYRADYGRLRGVENPYRFLAQRNFVSWCWGFLGRKVQVVLPSCVVLRIQAEFPDAHGPDLD